MKLIKIGSILIALLAIVGLVLAVMGIAAHVTPLGKAIPPAFVLAIALNLVWAERTRDHSVANAPIARATYTRKRI